MRETAFTATEIKRAIITWVVRAAFALAGYGLILFLAAGTLDWIWGWVLLGVFLAFLAAQPLIINPELLAERVKGVQNMGVKTWDKWIAMLALGMMMAGWLVAGLDNRGQWTGSIPLGYHLSGLLGILLGHALSLWAMASNAFFSEGVRIQGERGHKAITTGPYRFIRHPGYFGAILSLLATPLFLGSPWALIPSMASVILYVLRTSLEDKTLFTELTGYKAYAQQTCYRLLPGLW
jgi:protein-S-isoprenylcysteine O-methyltransferase Ste14